MVERGISIALRSTKGHYISDIPQDIVSNMELTLRYVITRLETMMALRNSSLQGQMTKQQKKDIVDRFREVITQLELDITDNDLWSIDIGIKELND